MHSLRFLAISLAVAAVGCANHGGPEGEDPERLSTEWGESRPSVIERVTFDRAEKNSPDIAVSLFYDDEEGVEAVVGPGSDRYYGPVQLAGSTIEMTLLRLDSGLFTSKYWPIVPFEGKLYAIGETGERYAIQILNKSLSRVEIVAAVDGHDVLDGRGASRAKRGYIVEPGSHIVIEGFRRSATVIAAFRFGPVSQARSRTNASPGSPARINVAVFREKGSEPLVRAEEP